VEVFRHSIGSFRRTAEADTSLPEPERAAAAARFANAFAAMLTGIEQRALEAVASGGDDGAGDCDPPVGCLELCRLRCAL
jgi:hypothetical protein